MEQQNLEDHRAAEGAGLDDVLDSLDSIAGDLAELAARSRIPYALLAEYCDAVQELKRLTA